MFACFLTQAIGIAGVRQVTMREMLNASELAFEGQVLAVESELTADGNKISTYVTFAIRDSIKGEYPQSTITLSFLGGTVGGLTMTVADMHLPEVGEQGVYFVESLRRRQVHPLYGWDQGHFLIRTDPDGTRRVQTRSTAKIVAVDSGRGKPTDALSAGVAVGVSTSDALKDKSMTVVEFKKSLREIMRGAR